MTQFPVTSFILFTIKHQVNKLMPTYLWTESRGPSLVFDPSPSSSQTLEDSPASRKHHQTQGETADLVGPWKRGWLWVSLKWDLHVSHDVITISLSCIKRDSLKSKAFSQVQFFTHFNLLWYCEHLRYCCSWMTFPVDTSSSHNSIRLSNGETSSLPPSPFDLGEGTMTPSPLPKENI